VSTVWTLSVKCWRARTWPMTSVCWQATAESWFVSQSRALVCSLFIVYCRRWTPVSVRVHQCPSVCLSTNRFFDFNEMWHVGRGRLVMHDGMQYDPIQGQGHEPLKVGNPAGFLN